MSRAGITQSVESSPLAPQVPVLSPTNACSQVHYVEEIGSAARLPVNRSAGIATEVKTYASASTNKAAHCGFETQRRRHQKSKTNVSVAPQKKFFVLEFLKKKNHTYPSSA